MFLIPYSLGTNTVHSIHCLQNSFWERFSVFYFYKQWTCTSPTLCRNQFLYIKSCAWIAPYYSNPLIRLKDNVRSTSPMKSCGSTLSLVAFTSIGLYKTRITLYVILKLSTSIPSVFIYIPPCHHFAIFLPLYPYYNILCSIFICCIRLSRWFLYPIF